MAMKLEKMTVKELDDVIAQAQQRKQAAYEAIKKQACVRIDAILTETGFTLDELYSTRTRGVANKSKKPAKFRNPGNVEETWSGYGRVPRWFVNAINKGMTKEELMVGSPRTAPAASKKVRAVVKEGKAVTKGAKAPVAAKKGKVSKVAAKPIAAPKRR